MQSKDAYDGYKEDAFNEVLLPGTKRVVPIFYAGFKKPGYEKTGELLQQISPAIIYLNIIFSTYFFLFPLLNIKKLSYQPRVVVCPRGMLQKGALVIKPFKKKVYLLLLSLSGLMNTAYWHATNEEEAKDIQKHFPKNRGIVIAANIPKPPFYKISIVKKEPGELRLVFLSLIAEKKNLLLLLELIKSSNRNVTLHIYGPVFEEKYWHSCKELIDQMPDKVQYKGEVIPVNVQPILSQYHALILLTKGENFGHAIYESLSVGRPVLISNYTPWNNLQESKAGINMDITNLEDCKTTLEKFIDMNQEEYNSYCAGAHSAAIQYYNSLESEAGYKELFY
jgi:glycosyltransferase involved in cell wall biosynthesis